VGLRAEGGPRRCRDETTAMLICTLPNAVLWPLFDWSVALLDALRVLSAGIPAAFRRPD